MADKRITQLNSLDTIADNDLFAVVDVSDNETKRVSLEVLKENLPGSSTNVTGNTYIVPEFLTISGSNSSPYPEYYLTGSSYENTSMIKVFWSGGNGEAHLILPDATTDTNQYRAIRLTMDANFASNDKAKLYGDPSLGQTLDGSSGGYTLDRAFEGIMVWSDGSNWIRIQTKA
jgi:hypothetical protein